MKLSDYVKRGNNEYYPYGQKNSALPRTRNENLEANLTSCKNVLWVDTALVEECSI